MSTNRYIDTRGAVTEPVNFTEAVIDGLAPGGGLFVPERIPELSLEDIRELGEMPYAERAASIYRAFDTDLTDEQIKRLDSIGMRWVKREEIQWQEQYADVQVYKQTFGNIDIPQSYKSPSGKMTGLWLQRQRKKLREGKLNTKQVQLLRAVGV